MHNLRLLAFALGDSQRYDTWIVESLQSMGGQNRLEKLIIAISQDPRMFPEIDFHGLLTPLDTLLTRYDFPHLSDVSIYLGGSNHNPPPSPRIPKDYAISAMPLLMEGGILHVDYVDTLHHGTGPFCVEELLST
jgi:hypothetical protein